MRTLKTFAAIAALACAVCLTAAPAHAQANWITVTASKIRAIGANDSTTLLPGGTMCWQATKPDGTPVSFYIGGGGQAVRNGLLGCVGISEGAIVGTFQVPNPQYTGPQGIYYHVTIQQGMTTVYDEYLGIGGVGVSSFNLDDFVPGSPPQVPWTPGATLPGTYGLANLNVTGSFNVNNATCTGTCTGFASTSGFASLTAGTNSNTGTFGASGNHWDFSGALDFKLPVAASFAAASNGSLGYDSTLKNWHAYSNSVDHILGLLPVSVTPANNDCVKWTVASGRVTLNTAGAACGAGGSAFFQTIRANGSDQAQEPALNFDTNFDLSDTAGSQITLHLHSPINVPTSSTAHALDANASGTGAQGNGTKVQYSTGATSTNDCVKYDSNGNTVSSGVPCANIDTTNILGVWKMDEGSGAIFADASGAGHNLTLCSSGQAPTRLAAPGLGAQFSGGQCATGGSALNSSRTLQFFVEYQDNNDLNLFDAIIAGNGGSATSHTSMALGLTRQTQPSNILYGGKVPAVALNNGGSPVGDIGVQSADVFNATAVVTFELGSASDSPATFDRVFFNGIESKQYIGGSAAAQSAGLQTSGVWSLGGISANGAWPQSLYFNGNIRYAVAYSDYKNAAVVASNTTFINNAMAARGVPVAIGSTQNNDIVVVEGDSIEQNPAPPAIGVPGGPWPSLLQLSIPSTAGTASYGFVQAIGTVAVGNGTSTPHQVFPSNVTSGNALIGFFRVPHGATFTITDTLGNAWFPILDPITGKTIANVPSSGSDDYLYCSGAHASGANTVTLNESGGTNDVWIGLLEYSGTAASANAPCSQFVENVSLLVDMTTTVGTGSTTVPSGTVLAVSNPDLLVSIMFMQERPITYTPGSGYTARLSGGSNNDILASDTAASPVASGFYSTSSTVTTSFSQPGYVSFLIAMKASTSFAGSSFQVANHGIGAARLLNMAASGATSVCTMFHPNAARNFLIIDAGINDLGAGQTPVQVWQNLSYFGRQMKSCGFSVAVATMGSAFRLGASMDPQKNAYNGLIRGTPLGIAWDALFDKAADPCIGADVAYGGSCFSGDEIHPNQTGANHIGAINQRGVNDFYGNRTFTSATTYTASAPAAEADNHAILGASAGSQTFTERSCVGFTSQRLYRKNTDTHSWTLAADGSEKFDAASTLTVAAGAMVIIESTLTSPTAGGCRWTVIQNQ